MWKEIKVAGTKVPVLFEEGKMIGLGTIVNCIAIIVGGIIGCTFGTVLKERVRDGLMKAMGLAVLFVGISGTLKEMLVIKDGMIETQGSLMMIVSLAVGCVVGEWIDIDAKFILFGEWLKKISGNQKDSKFTIGFVTSSLTVCIGAMAIVGAIQDGIYGNHNTLFLKAILDFVIIMILSTTLGKGCIFSAVSVFLVQMSATLLASLLTGVFSDAALSNLSLVGNILIFCVGVNLIHSNTFKVANLLPSILIALLYGLF